MEYILFIKLLISQCEYNFLYELNINIHIFNKKHRYYDITVNKLVKFGKEWIIIIVDHVELMKTAVKMNYDDLIEPQISSEKEWIIYVKRSQE